MAKGNSSYYADILPANKGKNAEGIGKKLIERGEKVKRRFEGRDAELDDVEKYYYNTGVKKDTDGEVYHVSVNDAQSAVDLIADLISGQSLKVVVPAQSESQKAKADANDTERWLEAWFKMTEREEDMRLVHEMAHDTPMRGAVVMRVMMLDERLPKKGKDKAMADFPLVPEVRDYRYCYPVYKRTKLVEVFECYESKMCDIRMDWDSVTFPESWGDDDEVMVWEWWSENKKAFWITGSVYESSFADKESNAVWLMHPTSHGCGVLPYSIRAMRPQGKKRADPEKMAQSLLQSWAGTLDAMNLIESAKFTSGMAYINSAWVVYTNRKNLDLDLTHGAVNYLYPEKGEKIEPIVKGDMPVDLMQIGDEWSTKFQRASIPTALYGENIGPNMAGYAIALLNESGRRILIPIVNAIEACMADSCGIALAIAENLLGPTLENSGHKMEIFVTHQDDEKRLVRRGVTLDWEKIDAMYMVEISLGDPMPQDQERNMNMAIAARQPDASGMPLLSDETIRMDILEGSDNERELTRILKERLIVSASDLIAEETAIEAGLIPDPAEEEARAGEEAAMQDMAMQQEQQMMMAQQQQMQPPMPPQPDPMMMQGMEEMAQRVAQLEEIVVQMAQAAQAPPQPQAPPMPEQMMMPPGGMPVEQAPAIPTTSPI